MTKVGIVYGWAEGRAHGKKLLRALHGRGYKITDKLEEADILITHSGGGLVVPSLCKARLIVMVGLPYWPKKHPLVSLAQKVKDEVTGRGVWWFGKNTWYVIYTLVQPRRLIYMLNAWRRNDHLFPQAPMFLLIRNERDHFVHPSEIVKLGEAKGWTIETLPGTHDDLWANPQPYIKLMEKHYGLLAKTN